MRPSRGILYQTRLKNNMKSETQEELSIRQAVKNYFGVDTDYRKLILYRVPAGRSAVASLFLTNKKQLFVYIESNLKVTLGDVKKIVSRMGLKSELYIPPRGRPKYFEDIANKKFHEVFPGRKSIGDEDLSFYRTLALYNPALVLISEVRDGEVKQYDTSVRGNWRVAARIVYKRSKALI